MGLALVLLLSLAPPVLAAPISFGGVVGGLSYSQSQVPLAFGINGTPAASQVVGIYPCGSQIELPAGLGSNIFPAATTQVSCVTAPSVGDDYVLANRDLAKTLATITVSTTANAGGASTYSTSGWCTSGNCIACTAGQTLTLTAPGTVKGEASCTFNVMGITP